MAREFAGPTAPPLNASFVSADPTNRIYAVTTEDQLQIRVRFKIKAKLPLPRNPAPMLY